jgi:hypothetical protein
MKNSLVPIANYPIPTGEVPCSLIENKNGKGKVKILATAPVGSTNIDNDGDGFYKYENSTIPIDAIIDLSKTDIGAGRVVLFGSSHITDNNFKKGNETPKYWRMILNNLNLK